jgi:hypothetical protein
MVVEVQPFVDPGGPSKASFSRCPRQTPFLIFHVEVAKRGKSRKKHGE